MYSETPASFTYCLSCIQLANEKREYEYGRLGFYRPCLFYPFFKRFYLFIYFREGKGGRKKGKEKCSLAHPPLGISPTTQACALTGYRTCDPLVHRPVLNPLSHTSQGLLWVMFRSGNITCTVSPRLKLRCKPLPTIGEARKYCLGMNAVRKGKLFGEQ